MDNRVGIAVSNITSRCPYCRQDTDHTILGEHDWSWVEEVGPYYEADNGEYARNQISGGTTYQFLRCNGCRKASLRLGDWHSEDWDAITGLNYTFTVAPPMPMRTGPTWITNIDHVSKIDGFQRIYEETVWAFSFNHFRIAAMGIRSMLDDALSIKLASNEGFAKKLKEAKSKDLITQVDFEILQKVLEVGHAATHRRYTPGRTEIEVSLDILEATIARWFVYPTVVASLADRLPPRQP